MKQIQLRNFVFTWNNPGRTLVEDLDDEDRQELIDKMGIDDARILKAKAYLHHLYHSDTIKIQYIIYGLEYGENIGTPHFQGYCELKQRISFNKLTRIFGGCHIEPRMGNQQQAIDYCRKAGDITSHGEPKIQGDRTDLQRLKLLLDTSSSIKTLLEDGEIVSAQALRVAEKLLKYTDKPRDYPVQVIWLYGASGVGKTKLARELLPDAYFKTNVSSKWWPNYDGQEDVIIDDLRSEIYPFIQILGLLDRYPYQVEDKGIIREFRGRRIIITTSCPPELTYYDEIKSIHGLQENQDQLLRRITLIEELK